MSLPIVDPRLAVAGYSDNETQRKLQIDELKKHKLVADNCRLCIPYIKKMIETGITKFDRIIE